MTLPDPQLQPEFYGDIPVKRTLAWLIDLVVVLLLTLIAVVLTLFVATLFFPLLFGAISIAYRTVMLSRWSATLGMQMMALKWRRLDGRTPDPGTAFVYSALHALVMMFVIPQIASIVLILLTPYRQGLHDLALGTTMLNRAVPD